MKRFKFRVFFAGGGTETFSYTKDFLVDGVGSKVEAQKKLAGELGCALSFLDEGNDCKITEIE